MIKISEYLNEIENTLKETRRDVKEAFEKGIAKLKKKKEKE